MVSQHPPKKINVSFKYNYVFMGLNIFDEFQSVVAIILSDTRLSHRWSTGASNWHPTPFDTMLVESLIPSLLSVMTRFPESFCTFQFQTCYLPFPQRVLVSFSAIWCVKTTVWGLQVMQSLLNGQSHCFQFLLSTNNTPANTSAHPPYTHG